jgi:hypothetical protein
MPHLENQPNNRHSRRAHQQTRQGARLLSPLAFGEAMTSIKQELAECAEWLAYHINSRNSHQEWLALDNSEIARLQERIEMLSHHV